MDDSLDLLAEHGIAGVVGLIFNALFAADWVIGMDGTTKHKGGWLTHNWKQMYIQIAYIGASAGYCAVVTAIICFVLGKIPGVHLRVTEEAEALGLDEDQIGEFAYDYVEVRRDYYQWGVDTDALHTTCNGANSASETNPTEDSQNSSLSSATVSGQNEKSNNPKLHHAKEA